MSIQSVARRILTNLAIVLPVAFASESAHATMQCPGSMVSYGEWAGGFCCDGSVGPDGGTCNGSVCALDPSRTQGLPLCYQENSPLCRNMGSLSYYAGMVGGFCCDGALGPDKNSCNGTKICALSGSNQGYPMCKLMEEQCSAGQHRYAEWAGGFCCNGTVAADGGSCNGSICALDADRAQGHMLCPTVMPSCSPWETRYGEWAGGFCCNGTVDPANGGTCNGTVCALDSNRSQGNPLCSDVAPPSQGTSGSFKYFSSSATGGAPFRIFAASAEVEETANGVAITGNVTISAGNGLPEITLADAEIEIGFDANRYISTLIGSAHASLPISCALEIDNLCEVTLCLAWGAELNDPSSAHHVEAPMHDDRQYVVFHVAAGISGSYGPVEFEVPGGSETLLVIDPRDPSVYFRGELSSVPGLRPLGEVGVGLSVQGLMPFEHENTWGIDSFTSDFEGHVLLEGTVPFLRLPLEVEGQLAVKLPTVNDLTTRVGANGTMNLSVEFVPNIASFSFDIANATVGGSFDAFGYGEAYFSGYVGTQGLIDALPDMSVIPAVGVRFAGRSSTNPANNFLRFSGNGAFKGHDVINLDMNYSPSGGWVSGNFQIGGGFRANLRGKVMATSADLSGEAYINIPIYGLKTIVSGSLQTINYVRNGSVCGYTTAANAAECGWKSFTSLFCQTFPELCTPEPETCRFANSCTEDVWQEETIQEPNFNYGSFTAKANFNVSTPDDITVSFANNVCPPGVGSCSVGAEDLHTASPKLCVTSEYFGKFCAPLVIR